MFERYTERARRVIFFARYEASQFGSASIETEHLLLGVLREDSSLPSRFLDADSSPDAISENARASLTARERTSTAIDLPLSMECRRILAYALEEAEKLNHRNVGIEHLVLGILHEEKCKAAEILRKHGLQLSTLREKLAHSPPREELLRQASPAHDDMEGKRAMLTHLLATLAYRVQKALRNAPEGFENFCAAPQVRTPHQLICHMINVLRSARTFLIGSVFPPRPPTDFRSDVKVFHETLDDIKGDLGKLTPFRHITPELLLQGPLSDALTHTGQLAMLRRLAGSPVPPENFIKAAINPENLGQDQPATVSPDEDWPERPPR